jgi:hypothetical protein
MNVGNRNFDEPVCRLLEHSTLSSEPGLPEGHPVMRRSIGPAIVVCASGFFLATSLAFLARLPCPGDSIPELSANRGLRRRTIPLVTRYASGLSPEWQRSYE